MTLLTEFIGRFHPLLLHLPIGILIYAYLHFSYNFFFEKRKSLDLSFALGLGAIASIISALSGYWLSSHGGYEGDLVFYHKWLGIGVAIGSVILFWRYQPKQRSSFFFVLFTIFMALLAVTGHYGGSITHGEGFLTTSSISTIATPAAITNVDSASAFHDLVLPIIERKCVSCHNPKKKKGGLLLDTEEGWKLGGKTGKFVVAGNVTESLMLRLFPSNYLGKELMLKKPRFQP